MFTTRGLMRKAHKKMLHLLEAEGLQDEFRIIKRQFKKDLEATIYIYVDNCPEFYEGPIYVAEIFKELPDGLIHTIAQPTLELLFRELEDFINE